MPPRPASRLAKRLPAPISPASPTRPAQSPDAVSEAFAQHWLSRQMGTSEIRFVAMLVASLAPSAAGTSSAETGPDALDRDFHAVSDAAEAIIIAHGGVLLRGGGGLRIVATWGAVAGASLDIEAPVAAAATLAGDTHWGRRLRIVVTVAPALVALADSGRDIVAEAFEQAHDILATLTPGTTLVSTAAQAARWPAAPPLAGPVPEPDTWPTGPTRLEHLIDRLAAEPTCQPLPPATRAAIAELADGKPDLGLLIARGVSTGQIDPDRLFALVETANPVSLALAAWLESAGPMKPLLKAVAIARTPTPTAILAAALDMSVAQLAPLVARACASGFLSRAHEADFDGSIDGCQAVAIPGRLARALLARSVPGDLRARLHRRFADALVAHYAGSGANAADIAQHYTSAGLSDAAARWWRRAGEEAIAASAAKAAVLHLEAARRQLGRPRPQSAGEARRIAGLLGPQLAATHGNAAPQVLANYARYSRFALRGRREDSNPGDTASRFDTLWGLLSCYLVRGDMPTAKRISARLLRCADQIGGLENQILAQRMVGLGDFLTGDLATARSRYQWVLAHHDPARHGALRFTYASDQATLAAAHLAWLYAVGGDAASAARSADDALARAEALAHPHTSAHAICVIAAAKLATGDRDDAAPLALAGRAIAQRSGFPYWSAWSAILLGALDREMSPGSRIAQLSRAIASYEAIGARQALPLAFALLAEQMHAAGRDAEARSALDTGLGHARASGISVFTASLVALRARLMSRI